MSDSGVIAGYIYRRGLGSCCPQLATCKFVKMKFLPQKIYELLKIMTNLTQRKNYKIVRHFNTDTLASYITNKSMGLLYQKL
jgi:hypothetical protein